MPQIIGTVTEDSGSVVTNYSDTVTNSVQTFTFSTQQDGMTFINKGNAQVTLTVNGKPNNVPPNGTIRLNCDFTSFDVTRIQTGSHPFEVNSFRLKNDVRDVEGFASKLLDIATVNDHTISYSYYPNGSVQTITEKDSSNNIIKTITYTYNTFGDVATSATVMNGKTVTTTYNYDAGKNVTSTVNVIS